MAVRQVTEKDRVLWDKVVTHPVQSWEWGEFREKTGLPVVRFVSGTGKNLQGFQLTIHSIPFTPWNIGYLPKCNLPTKEVIEELKKIGRKYNCTYIQIEPHVEIVQNSKVKGQNYKSKVKSLGLLESLRPLFFKYTFIIDLTKSEEEIVAKMHPKARYNIRVAQKHGVRVEERVDNEAFKIFLKLYFETIKRQKYFGHTPGYHRLLWQTIKSRKSKVKSQNDNSLSARILIAYYTPPDSKNKTPLAAWMIFKFGDKIYYPYGGSSDKYKNVMANNLVVWEAIKLGKKLGAREFDLWGCLGPNANPKDPWYGFHRFKQGYGGKLIEYVGSYDLVLNPTLYFGFHLIEKLRWLFLRIRSVF